MSAKIFRIVFLLFLLTLSPCSSEPAHSITPVERENVENALKLLGRYGENATVERFGQAYRDGKVTFGHLSDGNAETDVYDGTILLDKTGGSREMDPTTVTGRAGLQAFAKTIHHEVIHLTRQVPDYVTASNVVELLGGDNSAELQAWYETLSALERWALFEERWGDKVARTREEKITAYRDAQSLNNIAITELQRFPDKGYGQLSYYPYRSVEHWISTLEQRRESLRQTALRLADEQDAAEAENSNSPPEPTVELPNEVVEYENLPLSITISAPPGRSPQQTGHPSRTLGSEAILGGVIEEIEARRRDMAARYDYGRAGTDSLLQAMRAQGVGYAQRYAPSWSDNGVYLRWSEADQNFYRNHIYN
ncbi:MAG: hypothetical protein WC314_25025 [Vulcanimicrobiota bacterium]